MIAATFAATLMLLPMENMVISDAVYASSTTIDGRHFAEEFIRRKKLADKGVVEKNSSVGSGVSGSGSGWSEVAKKSGSGNGGSGGSGSVREQSTESSISGAGFKVVPSRKKTGKK